MMRKMGPEIFALDHFRRRLGSIWGVSMFRMEGLQTTEIRVGVWISVIMIQVSAKEWD
jgi:hypothetical protein